LPWSPWFKNPWHQVFNSEHGVFIPTIRVEPKLCSKLKTPNICLML
jgi:hypothetical protein